MKRRFLLCACFLLLSACAQPPAAEPPAAVETAPVRTAAPTPSPAPAQTPGPTPCATPTPIPAGEWENYEPCHIGEIGATLLLPKSWAGNYELDTEGWEEWRHISFGLTGCPGGEIGDEPGEGLLSMGSVSWEPLEEYEDFWGTVEEKLARLESGEDTGYNHLHLGIKDGVVYSFFFPTTYSTPVPSQENYERFQTFVGDMEKYPFDSSAYFIFDTP